MRVSWSMHRLCIPSGGQEPMKSLSTRLSAFFPCAGMATYFSGRPAIISIKHGLCDQKNLLSTLNSYCALFQTFLLIGRRECVTLKRYIYTWFKNRIFYLQFFKIEVVE